MRKRETFLLVLVVLAQFATMGCENDPTPTPTLTPVYEYQPLCPGCDIATPESTSSTPMQTPTATPNAEELTKQIQDLRNRTPELCSKVEEERQLYRSMVDDYLAFGDRITQDGVITEAEGVQMRADSARTEHQLQAISTAEQRCDDAKQRVQVLEDALRQIDVNPTATATPRLTPTVPRLTATPTRTPTPVPTATPTPVQKRYQVFFDDIELVKDSDLWNWTNCQRVIEAHERDKQRMKELGGPEPFRPIWRPCLIELEQRIQLLRHEPSLSRRSTGQGYAAALTSRCTSQPSTR